MLPHFMGNEIVEWIEFFLNSCGDEELPQLESSMRIVQAKAVFGKVEEWEEIGKIQAIGFDNTAVNTDSLKGT